MVKNAILWLILYFVKCPEFCYVKEKSCNKTHFELFNIV